jgi:hypothetical protein
MKPLHGVQGERDDGEHGHGRGSYNGLAMGEAEEKQIRELRFRVGDALPADDPLARFILVVSMGLNDNSFSNTHFVGGTEDYELLYFFRLASGHLHELANRLRVAHEEWPDVQEFVAGLDEQYRDDFAAIVQLADGKNATGRSSGASGTSSSTTPTCCARRRSAGSSRS